MSLAYGFFLPAVPDLGLLVPPQAQFQDAAQMTPLPGARPGIAGLAATREGPAVIIGMPDHTTSAAVPVLVLGTRNAPWGLRIDGAPRLLDAIDGVDPPAPRFAFQQQAAWAQERWWWAFEPSLLRHWLLEEGLVQ